MRLYDKKQTGAEMKRLVKKYHTDLPRKLRELSITEFFEKIKNLKYRRDKKPVEIVARPKILLSGYFSGLDCKKKAELMAAFFTLKKIPWRFIAVSQRPDKSIHHVFTQYWATGRGWLNADATYKKYRLNQPKKVTAWEIL